MKTIYRIELISMEWHIAKDIAVLAAFSNGSAIKLTIEELATAAKVRNAELGGQPFTISLVGNILHIDKGTEALLKLTEVEVMELDVPTLSCYDAKGLLDEQNHELLN